MEQHQQRHTATAPQRNQTANERECPICISEPRFAIKTNCGHLFCGNCIVAYWQSRQWDGPMLCPMCRRQIIILLNEFTNAEHRMPSTERQQVIDDVNRYNTLFAAEPQSWFQSARDVPTLLRHCFSAVISQSGLEWMFRLRFVMFTLAALIYLVIPFDLIPEMLLGIIGLVDDFIIIAALAVRICIEYRLQIAALATAAAAAGL